MWRTRVQEKGVSSSFHFGVRVKLMRSSSTNFHLHPCSQHSDVWSQSAPREGGNCPAKLGGLSSCWEGRIVFSGCGVEHEPSLLCSLSLPTCVLGGWHAGGAWWGGGRKGYLGGGRILHQRSGWSVEVQMGGCEPLAAFIPGVQGVTPFSLPFCSLHWHRSPGSPPGTNLEGLRVKNSALCFHPSPTSG